jgi:hypothetical protein
MSDVACKQVCATTRPVSLKRRRRRKGEKLSGLRFAQFRSISLIFAFQKFSNLANCVTATISFTHSLTLSLSSSFCPLPIYPNIYVSMYMDIYQLHCLSLALNCLRDLKHAKSLFRVGRVAKID